MSKKQNIPVFILAGGMGTRISDDSDPKPKPMIEIGGIPILLHIMRWYYSFGFDDFVICAGYRSWEIKNYFLTYEFRQNHLKIDHRESVNTPPSSFGARPSQERWRVRVIDTGVDCMTGGRVARAIDEIAATDDFEDFALTYGDGLADVDLKKELAYHQSHQRIGTTLGVQPAARFGELDITGDGQVSHFLEKPQSHKTWINGGFFFLRRDFRSYLSDSADCILEKSPLARLAEDGELRVHYHSGFWQPMDTPRDKAVLQKMWDDRRAPWVPGVGT